ncbi:MAG: LPXTG cell wall anchor domain-containing protein [Aeromicrobium sp.]|uniref:LPXTG cell wall anchor domain-containing protein n=1 Tax=Aeromicrobium sp. TaxID=1871063 RepID=UPI0039E34E55
MLAHLGRLIGVMTVATPLLTVSAAHAADGAVGVSADGVTWTSALAHPVFDPEMTWIPGDSETGSFFVRNQGPSAAYLTIEARSTDADALLASGDIDLRARIAGGEDWVVLDNGVPSQRLVDQPLARSAVVEVEVNATFDAASANQSQTKRLAVDFDVTLTEASDAGDGSGTAGNSGGLLPTTGAAISVWTAAAGAALLAAGSWIMRRRRGQACHG